jgi:hypothetical protein
MVSWELLVVIYIFLCTATIPDDVLAGWVNSLSKVYHVIGGCPTSVAFLLISQLAHRLASREGKAGRRGCPLEEEGGGR